MSERESIRRAVDDRDVTLALTAGQLILVVIGLFVLVRIIRGLRRG